MSDATRALETPDQLINELFRRVRDLESRELRKALAEDVTEFRWAVERNTTGGTISTTEAVEMTATVVIPADWNTYDLVAWLAVDILESGTLAAARTVTIRLRRTNLAGADIGAQAPALDNANTGGGQVRTNVAVVGYSSAQTGTGNQNVVFTTTIGADTGQASWDQAGLVLHAYRIS